MAITMYVGVHRLHHALHRTRGATLKQSVVLADIQGNSLGLLMSLTTMTFGCLQLKNIVMRSVSLSCYNLHKSPVILYSFSVIPIAFLACHLCLIESSHDGGVHQLFVYF